MNYINGDTIRKGQIYSKDGGVTGKVETFSSIKELIKLENQDKKEEVNHPEHYNQGKYEVLDVIEDWNLGFCLDNVIKYVARCNYKGNKKKDLEKAKFYLERELEKCDKE